MKNSRTTERHKTKQCPFVKLLLLNLLQTILLLLLMKLLIIEDLFHGFRIVDLHANCKMFVTISVASAGALLLAFTHNHKSCWPGLAYTLPWPLCSTFCKHGMVWYGDGRLGSLRFESMSITTMSQGAHCWQAVWAAVARLLRMPSEKLAVSTWACSCSRLELIGHITLQLASRNKEPQLVPQPQAYHQKIIKQLTQT